MAKIGGGPRHSEEDDPMRKEAQAMAEMGQAMGEMAQATEESQAMGEKVAPPMAEPMMEEAEAQTLRETQEVATPQPEITVVM